MVSFRMEIVRAGLPPEAAALAEELEAASADFRRFWAEDELPSPVMGRKRIQHPVAGSLTLDCSALSVDGTGGLGPGGLHRSYSVRCAGDRAARVGRGLVSPRRC